MIYQSPEHQIPDLLHEIKDMRRELGLLKTAFSLLNEPAVYLGTAETLRQHSISRHVLFTSAAQGQLSPVLAGRNIGWYKNELDEWLRTYKRPVRRWLTTGKKTAA